MNDKAFWLVYFSGIITGWLLISLVKVGLYLF